MSFKTSFAIWPQPWGWTVLCLTSFWMCLVCRWEWACCATGFSASEELSTLCDFLWWSGCFMSSEIRPRGKCHRLAVYSFPFYIPWMFFKLQSYKSGTSYKVISWEHCGSFIFFAGTGDWSQDLGLAKGKCTTIWAMPTALFTSQSQAFSLTGLWTMILQPLLPE
jgi:hypothetical protein